MLKQHGARDNGRYCSHVKSRKKTILCRRISPRARSFAGTRW